MTRDTFDMFNPQDRGRFGDNESQDIRGNESVRSDLVDLELMLRQNRPLSLMVTKHDAPYGAPWVSLPKSLIEYEIRSPLLVAVTMPRMLAREKGLL